MTEITQELAQRMADLVRDLRASHVKNVVVDTGQGFIARTAAIVAELPELVDPDLIEVRKICAQQSLIDGYKNVYETIINGENDKSGSWGVPQALAAIKRGRELAEAGK